MEHRCLISLNLMFFFLLTAFTAWAQREFKGVNSLSHHNNNLGGYKALIIGINDYEDQRISDLDTAVNDANEMAAVLTSRYGFEVKRIINRSATKKNIYQALRDLVNNTQADDSVLLYFAGHGDIDRTFNDGWWIPVDATGGDPITYFDNLQVHKAIKNMKARHVLLISDSCYAGTLLGKFRRMPQVIDDKYYLNLYKEKSRWGMTSGNKTPVGDDGTDGHSFFAYQLLKQLKENHKPYFSAQEIFNRIAPIVANNSEQTPLYRPMQDMGDQGGEFVFISIESKKLDLDRSKPSDHTAESFGNDKLKPLRVSGKKEKKILANDLGMEFVYIPPGRFYMGSPGQESGRDPDETAHPVKLTNGFYIGRTEVTVGQWRAFTKATGYCTEAEKEFLFKKDGWRSNYVYSPSNSADGDADPTKFYWDSPGFTQTDNMPVTCISFNDIRQFIKWLNSIDGRNYCLPTEAQWEYACRAKSKASRFWGRLSGSACTYGNVADSSFKSEFSKRSDALNVPYHTCDDGYVYTAPVASFKSNNYGLYDMLGNVIEWCRDNYGDYNERVTARSKVKYWWTKRKIRSNSEELFEEKAGYLTDPKGPFWGVFRVVRGGGWHSNPNGCRSSNRGRRKSDYWDNKLGFRLVIE